MLDPLVIEGRGVDPFVRDGCFTVERPLRDGCPADDETLWAMTQEWHEYGMASGMSKATFRRREPWRQAAIDLAVWLGREL